MYDIRPNNPVVVKTLHRGRTVRLPFALYVNGKHLSDHTSIPEAERQKSAHRRKVAERKLEELQEARQFGHI